MTQVHELKYLQKVKLTSYGCWAFVVAMFFLLSTPVGSFLMSKLLNLKKA